MRISDWSSDVCSSDLLHRWQLSFSAVWNETSPVKEPMPDNFFYWRKARLLPDGGLLAIFVVTGDTPWGYGMVKLDKDSNVIWSYLGQTHHDFDMGADGRRTEDGRVGQEVGRTG